MEEIRDREQEKIPKRNLIRFILLSTAGAVLFFAPVWEGNIPVAAMINGNSSAMRLIPRFLHRLKYSRCTHK